MEESYFIASLQIIYHSQTITSLEAELYDFSDNFIQAVHLTSDIITSLPIKPSLRSFYFRIINSD
jgi:hypothetical protein